MSEKRAAPSAGVGRAPVCALHGGVRSAGLFEGRPRLVKSACCEL